MITIFRFTNVIIFISMLFTSCSNPPLPENEESITPPPLTLPSSGSREDSSLSMRDIYFVIDESTSMTAKDSSGESCDSAGLRYDIPLFMAQILKNLSDQGVVNIPNFYLLLKDEQANSHITPTLITLDQMIEKLTSRRHDNPINSSVQPFDATKNPDALQSVFDVAKDEDYVFLFTDGDFRKDRASDDPHNSDAYDTSVKVSDLFANKNRNLKTFVFSLCSRRIESENNRFIKETWENIYNKKQAFVYGLDLSDLHDKTNVRIVIHKMLLEWLGDWNNRLEHGYAIRGWGWRIHEDIAPVKNVTPNLLRLRYGAISFSEGILPIDLTSQPAIRIQIDGLPPPELDTSFPAQIDDFIPPTERCGPHHLEFDSSAITYGTFYWWWADVPKIYINSNQPLILYNNNSDNYDFTVKVKSSLKDEFLKNINSGSDLNEFLSPCQQFYVTMDSNSIPLVYQGNGNLLLKNMSNPFVKGIIPLPLGNGIMPLTFSSEWLNDFQYDFSASLLNESKNVEVAKIRYYPIRRKDASPSVLDVSQGRKLIIHMDFFEKKYYPSLNSVDGISENAWQPTIQFKGDSCPLGLTIPATPPYQSTGGQSPSFDIKIIQIVESEIDIAINLDSYDNLKYCNKLILSWEKKPIGIEDWLSPPEIELICRFDNNILECK